MHVFHIKGFSGLMMFLLTAVGLLGLLVLLPATLMMVFWNAIVFEGFNGPEIGLTHGMVLWAMALILVKLVFDPKLAVEFKKIEDPQDIDKHLQG